MNEQKRLDFSVLNKPKAMAITDRVVRETHDRSREELRETLELALRFVAHHHPQFTADHVWDHLGEELDKSLTAGQKSVVGQIFRNLSKEGIITQTGNFIRSERPSSHRKPLPVWRSNVFIGVNEVNR